VQVHECWQTAPAKISTQFYHAPQAHRYYNKIDQIIKKNMNPKIQTKNPRQNPKKSLTGFSDYGFNGQHHIRRQGVHAGEPLFLTPY